MPLPQAAGAAPESFPTGDSLGGPGEMMRIGTLEMKIDIDNPSWK